MKESQFQMIVIDLARLYGWRVAHFRTSRTQSGGWATAVQADGAGFPDLVMLRGDRIIFAELKVGYRKPSDKQRAWLAGLALVGESYLWYDRDLDTIKEVLR